MDGGLERVEDLLLGRPELRSLLESGASLERMQSLWSDDLRRFRELREDYLLYS